MSPTRSSRRSMLRSSVLLVTTLILLLAVADGVSAFNRNPPYHQASAYPIYGCYDIATAGIGMWDGVSPYQQEFNVPGPVADAYLYWIGTEDVGAPGAPTRSDLMYNGTTVVGEQTSAQSFLHDPPWYMWRANIGPKGYNLIAQGNNKFTLSGWGEVDVPASNGASVVVVYSTGNCARPNQVNLIDNMNYYWERLTDQQTTNPMVFTFPPAPVDQEITIWLHHAGTYRKNVEQNFCRPEAIWEVSGTGTPPETLIDYNSPSTSPVGAKKIVQGAFWQAECGTPQTQYPLVDLLGWRNGQGPTPWVGGFISAEWSISRLKVVVPAGNTWLALQGESVRTGDPDPFRTGESEALFGQAVVPLYNPELRVAKTDGVSTAQPGDNLTYTITYENYGAAPAQSTTLVDKLPEHSGFVSASNGGTFNATDRTVTWNLGTLAAGAKGQVTLTVKLDVTFPAGKTTLTNQVIISSPTPGDTNPSDNTAIDTTDVTAKVELAIQKSAAPEPVEAGGALTYSFSWTVTGNAVAPGVTIVDTLPATVTFVSASNGGVFNPATNQVTWNLGDVTPAASGTYAINVTVKSPLYSGSTFLNAVTIADGVGDNATATATSTVHSDHTLSIAKVAAPEPVEAGSNLTYTITWSVAGNEPSPNAMIVDTLPPHVAYVSATGGGVYDPAGRTITWSLDTVMPPQGGSFEVVVTVESPLRNGAQLTNIVNFKDDDAQTPPAQATVVSTVHADHELHIAKADNPDPVEKGAQLTYVIDWSITGNEPADGVALNDPLPFGTQFVSATNGGSYNPATGEVVWTLGNLSPFISGTVTLVVQVNKDFPNGLDISNRVTISDAVPGKEKTAQANTRVVQTPQGSIGDTVWYDANSNGIQEPGEPGIPGVTLTLYNAGPDSRCGTADDTTLATTITDSNGKYRFAALAAGTYCVMVTDSTVPPGLVLTGGTNPHGPIALAEGQQYNDADFGYGPKAGTGTIGDRVWSDANGNGLQDSGEVGIGNVTLALMNAGPDQQCGTADDTSIANTTTASDGSYLFTGVAPGTYCVKVTDTNQVLTGLTLTGGTNPHGPIHLPAGGTYLDADFGYHGTTNYTGRIGDLVFYDANRNGVFEPGPIERGISGVTLSLMTPGPDGAFGTSDDVQVATAVTDGNGNYLFDGLPDGRYEVIVTDLNGRLVGYTQTYGVPNTNNNGQVSPYPATISGGNQVLTADFSYADGHLLTVTKTNNLPVGSAAEAGTDFVWTISYSVTGRETAPNVMLKDPLPTQVDFVSASNGGTFDPATRLVTWSLGNLNPGASGSVTLTVHVKKPLPNNSYIFNTVTIVDDARVTDQDTDIVRVHSVPVLALTKTNQPTGEVKPGDTIIYTLCYSNTGNGDATGVLLTDALPRYTSYVAGSATNGGTYDAAAGMLTWNLGTLAPDATGCVSFAVTVNMTIPGAKDVSQGLTIDNTATLTSNELPPLTASTSNPLNALVKLALTKANNPTGEVMPGDTITYTICYANNGNANATGVVLKDAIPAYTTYLPGSAIGGAVYDEPNRMLTWNIGVLAPGESACVRFSVTVDTKAGQAAALSFSEWSALAVTNTAILKSDQLPDLTATVTNPLNAVVNPMVVKSASSPMVHMGETIVFTVTATNNGTATAHNVVVTDTIHPKLSGVTLTTSKGTASYDVATRVWTVLIGTLAPGESVTIVLTGTSAVVIPQELPYGITNTAILGYEEGSPRISNTVGVTVVGAPLPSEIPEPGTWLLLGVGLAGLGGYVAMRARGRRKRA